MLCCSTLGASWHGVDQADANTVPIIAPGTIIVDNFKEVVSIIDPLVFDAGVPSADFGPNGDRVLVRATFHGGVASTARRFGRLMGVPGITFLRTGGAAAICGAAVGRAAVRDRKAPGPELPPACVAAEIAAASEPRAGTDPATGGGYNGGVGLNDVVGTGAVTAPSTILPLPTRDASANRAVRAAIFSLHCREVVGTGSIGVVFNCKQPPVLSVTNSAIAPSVGVRPSRALPL